MFESELITPEKYKKRRLSENYQEWLMKFRFGKWVLADIDNYLKGNPLFLFAEGGKRYDSSIFKNTAFDPQLASNLRETD